MGCALLTGAFEMGDPFSVFLTLVSPALPMSEARACA